MKRVFLTLIMAVMLTASLAACGSTDTNDTNTDARTRVGGKTAMDNGGRYYADGNGDVFGNNDGIGDDIGRAADDMMDGVDRAMRDMTH